MYRRNLSLRKTARFLRQDENPVLNRELAVVNVQVQMNVEETTNGGGGTGRLRSRRRIIERRSAESVKGGVKSEGRLLLSLSCLRTLCFGFFIPDHTGCTRLITRPEELCRISLDASTPHLRNSRFAQLAGPHS